MLAQRTGITFASLWSPRTNVSFITPTLPPLRSLNLLKLTVGSVVKAPLSTSLVKCAVRKHVRLAPCVAIKQHVLYPRLVPAVPAQPLLNPGLAMEKLHFVSTHIILTLSSPIRLKLTLFRQMSMLTFEKILLALVETVEIRSIDVETVIRSTKRKDSTCPVCPTKKL